MSGSLLHGHFFDMDNGAIPWFIPMPKPSDMDMNQKRGQISCLCTMMNSLKLLGFLIKSKSKNLEVIYRLCSTSLQAEVGLIDCCDPST